jgi:hypothetical protein
LHKILKDFKKEYTSVRHSIQDIKTLQNFRKHNMKSIKHQLESVRDKFNEKSFAYEDETREISKCEHEAAA